MLKTKIPLWLAITTNINIIIGAAFFIGASDIAYIAGKFAPFLWILVAAFLMPLVFILTKLSEYFPLAGGLYVYPQKVLGKFWGFLSGWGYFLGTAVGNAVVLHAFTVGLDQLGYLPHLFPENTPNYLCWNLIFLVLEKLICLRGIEMLKPTQILIAIFTFIPIVLVLITTPFLGDVQTFYQLPAQSTHWLSQTFPMILFAYIGIEASCAMAHAIEHSHVNTGKAIYLSFLITMGIYAACQYGLMALLGEQATQGQPFAKVAELLTQRYPIIFPTWCIPGISLCIVISFLGGAYGMFYTNNWNLYAMAKDHCIVGNVKWLTHLNRNNMPSRVILLQTLIMAFFFILIHNKNALIIMNDLGVFIAYFASSIAFSLLKRKKNWKAKLISLLALISSGFLLITCLYTLLIENWYHILPFVACLILGAISFWYSKARFTQ